jgi:hypothetical protein
MTRLPLPRIDVFCCRILSAREGSIGQYYRRSARSVKILAMNLNSIDENLDDFRYESHLND